VSYLTQAFAVRRDVLGYISVGLAPLESLAQITNRKSSYDENAHSNPSHISFVSDLTGWMLIGAWSLACQPSHGGRIVSTLPEMTRTRTGPVKRGRRPSWPHVALMAKET
jgi:hypothetical protein